MGATGNAIARRQTHLGRIVFYRPRYAWQDRWRVYRVVIDGREVGSLRNGAELETEVPPGSHTVRVAIDWTGSPPLDVLVAAGATVVVRVEPTKGDPLARIGSNDTYLQISVEDESS